MVEQMCEGARVLGGGGGRRDGLAVDLKRFERHDEYSKFNVRRILRLRGIHDIKHRCVRCVCRQRASLNAIGQHTENQVLLRAICSRSQIVSAQRRHIVHRASGAIGLGQFVPQNALK